MLTQNYRCFCSQHSSVHAPAEASSFTSTSSLVSTSTSAELSQEEVDQLAHDLEVLFTRYIQQDELGNLYVNSANLAADGMAEKAAELNMLAKFSPHPQGVH